MKRLAVLLLVLSPYVQAFATIEVLRDSIGPDSSLTDGMPGGSTNHDGEDFGTPGLVVNAPETGILNEAKFVIFVRGDGLNPENNLEAIYTYHMEFHIWTEGIQGGVDSYDQNPRSLDVGGHIKIDANTPDISLITVQPWGHTGPPSDPTLFTTFLITIDLSSSSVELQAGQQYVMSLLQKDVGFDTTVSGSAGGFYRISGSRSTGTVEDLFRDVFSTDFPGYIDSQLGSGFEQYAGALTLGNGDYDGDHDVDGRDFLEWQRNFGGSVAAQQDSNGDGLADGKDLAIWQATYGESWAAPPSSTAVPEPTTIVWLSMSATLIIVKRRNYFSP